MCEIFGRRLWIVDVPVDQEEPCMVGTHYAGDENREPFRKKKQARAFADRKFPGEKVSIYPVKVVKPRLK
jgi:hypothetical protein